MERSKELGFYNIPLLHCTRPQEQLQEGNVFTSVYHSFEGVHDKGGHVWQRGYACQGVCVVKGNCGMHDEGGGWGHAWQSGGMCGKGGYAWQREHM